LPVAVFRVSHHQSVVPVLPAGVSRVVPNSSTGGTVGNSAPGTSRVRDDEGDSPMGGWVAGPNDEARSASTANETPHSGSNAVAAKDPKKAAQRRRRKMGRKRSKLNGSDSMTGVARKRDDADPEEPRRVAGTGVCVLIDHVLLHVCRLHNCWLTCITTHR
jgi:hypothetical protein